MPNEPATPARDTWNTALLGSLFQAFHHGGLKGACEAFPTRDPKTIERKLIEGGYITPPAKPQLTEKQNHWIADTCATVAGSPNGVLLAKTLLKVLKPIAAEGKKSA